MRSACHSAALQVGTSDGIIALLEPESDDIAMVGKIGGEEPMALAHQALSNFGVARMFRGLCSGVVRQTAAVAIGVMLAMSAGSLARAEDEQISYASPDEAVTGLVDAIRSDDPAPAIVRVLGPDGENIATSGDPVADEARLAKFLKAFEDGHQVQQEDASKAVLLVGQDEFPFPIPIVAKDGKWRWDTAQGLEEILTRRIGENELATIEVMLGYVAAQIEYAEQERDGKGLQYARRLMSREGRKDGLYWAVAEGDDPSPIGPLVAEAQRKGYSGTGTGQAYNGYVFRMLYGQGGHASDGARDYIVNDRMIGGFALIATPADYGNSGVMTFIVNQDGDVYEKDLGPDSAERAARIKLFDPDTSWKKVESE
jgi:hypothetical protein